MDKFEALRIFIEVAKHQSFIAASQKLGVSAPAVTRAIASLEENLGVMLFHRTTRTVRLTEPGKHFAEDTKSILETLDEAEAAVLGTYTEPKGTLSITAPVQFGEKCVMPIIVDYLSQHPKVTVNAMFYDRITSLVEEDIDIAIRIGHLSDSNLYAKKVGTVRKVVCASPAYFAKHGKPETPNDLIQHKLILPTATDSLPIWYFQNNGKRVSIKFAPVMKCNQINASLSAAREGLGITRLLSYQVAADIEAGLLETALVEFQEPEIPVSIIHLEGRRANAKIRSFIDFAEQHFKNNVYINEKKTD